MGRLLIAGLLLFGSATAGHALECPDGTVSHPIVSPRQSKAEFCARSDGVRHGPYAEWASDGRRIIWGNFSSGVENGVWTMDVGTVTQPKIVFVVFDSGVDITETVLAELLPRCTTWKAMTPLGRAGVLATLSLLVVNKLTGGPEEIVATNRGAVAACLAVGATESDYATNGVCENDGLLTEDLRKAVQAIGAACVLQQKKRWTEAMV